MKSPVFEACIALSEVSTPEVTAPTPPRITTLVVSVTAEFNNVFTSALMLS